MREVSTVGGRSVGATHFYWSPDGTELAAAVLHDEPPSIERAVAAMDGIGPVADRVPGIHVIDGPTLDAFPVFESAGARILFSRPHAPDTTLFGEQPLLVDRKGAVQETAWTGSACSTTAPTSDGPMALASTYTTLLNDGVALAAIANLDSVCARKDVIIASAVALTNGSGFSTDPIACHGRRN